jgi:hypothetical protein
MIGGLVCGFAFDNKSSDKADRLRVENLARRTGTLFSLVSGIMRQYYSSKEKTVALLMV